MSTRKKALFILPLIFVMVFSLLVPLQTPVYAASDSYIVSDDYAQVKGGTLSGKLWENSKSYLYVVGDTTKYSLVKKSKSTGKVKTLVKKLPNKIVDGFATDCYLLNAVYGNNVYIARAKENKGTFWTYKYNLKTKKLTRVSGKGGVVEQRGKYLVLRHETASGEISASKHSLYKILNNGNIKKIKSLGHIYWPQKVGKYLYYTYSKDDSLHKVKIYRCRFNGKDKKCLGTFEAKYEHGFVRGFEFHKTWCHVEKDGRTYRYTYKTKKLTPGV